MNSNFFFLFLSLRDKHDTMLTHLNVCNIRLKLFCRLMSWNSWMYFESNKVGRRAWSLNDLYYIYPPYACLKFWKSICHKEDYVQLFINFFPHFWYDNGGETNWISKFKYLKPLKLSFVRNVVLLISKCFITEESIKGEHYLFQIYLTRLLTHGSFTSFNYFQILWVYKL